MATGANRDGVHLRGVDVARDIVVSRWADLREVAEGEPCPRCGQPLQRTRTVEIGHIFKLGRRYTETLGVTVLGADGERIAPAMGSYGIGVERAMAAIVESHHDERGIVWPRAVAPFHVAIAQLGTAAHVKDAADELYESLRGKGFEILLDDRAERPGVKFSDIELIGVPLRVTVSERGLAAGTVEVTTRSTGETERVAPSEVSARLGGR
jgi:prolyl-tRNA synthetase